MKPAGVALSLIGVFAVAIGCSAPTSTTAPESRPATSIAPSSSTPPAATVVSDFDPRWIGLALPETWRESDRKITDESQQFGLRPVDENEMPRRCNGCGVEPPTAFLTAYAPGKLDPAEARKGEAISVNTDNDGFFLPSRGTEDAVLSWQYGDDAWATVRGRTTMTSERDRMLELARSLRPNERTKISVPLSIPDLPTTMSLAEIYIDRGQYGTALSFYNDDDSLRVQIWPADGYGGHIEEQNAEPVTVGGRSGLYDRKWHDAAVQVVPGMLVVFELSGPDGPPVTDLKEILAAVRWAPDPADEQTWQAVSDWVKVA